MKRLKYAFLGLALFFGLISLVIYFNINGIVRRSVETHATNSLSLPTTVGGARLSLFGGHLSLSDVQIGSPQGFTAPYMMKLDGGDVSVRYSQLRSDPVRIASVTLDRPRILIEQSGGQFNFQALMDQASKAPKDSGSPKDGQRQDGEPIRMVIDKLSIKNATVVLRPGLPGLDQEITVPVPSLELDNVGTGEGTQNGAAIKEVVLEVISALAAQTGNANLPEQLKNALKQNAQAVAEKLNAELSKKIQDLTGSVNDALKNTGTRVDKVLPKNLNDLLGSEKSEKSEKKSEQPRKPRTP